MSHYAKIVDGKVAEVIVADADVIASLPGQWLQTSYNTHRGLHHGEDGQPDGGTALRGNYAGVGHVYNAEQDVFHAPQPYPSWTIGAPDWTWKAPLPAPALTDGTLYRWDEDSKSWMAV